MKTLIQRKLLIIMVAFWVTYGFISYIFIMPLFKNQLLHCILESMLFGIINYFIIVFLYQKYVLLEKVNQELEIDIRTDKLTGLLNRQAFDNDINTMGIEPNYSILFIDIDNFSNFNNRYGHGIGDSVLQKVSQTIKCTVRYGDYVYRYGGEEIVVILKDCSNENAIKIAEKIRTNVANMENSPYQQITISLGISICPDDGTDIYIIVEKSDKALLEAKNKGKNCACKYHN